MRKLLFSELSDIIAIYVDVPLHNKMSSKTRTAFFGFRQALCFAAILESKKKILVKSFPRFFFFYLKMQWSAYAFFIWYWMNIDFFFLSGAPSVFFLEWSQIQETFCLKVQ